jgi:hypothetical protein
LHNVQDEKHTGCDGEVDIALNQFFEFGHISVSGS